MAFVIEGVVVLLATGGGLLLIRFSFSLLYKNEKLEGVAVLTKNPKDDGVVTGGVAGVGVGELL